MRFLPFDIYSLLQKIGCALIQLTPDLIIKEFNNEAENIYQCTAKMALGKHFIQLCKNMNITPPLQDFQAILAGERVEEVVQDFSTNQSFKQLRWTIVPALDYKNSMQVTSILLIGMDENIFLDHEEMVKKIKDFEYIINNLPHAIFWKDKNSTFLGCNEAFAQTAMLKSTKEIIGKTDYDLPWSKEESAGYITDDQTVIRTKKEISSVEESLTVNNEQSFLLTSKVPLCAENGDVTGILGIFTDITKLKKIENKLQIAAKKSEATSQLKSALIVNMNYEIRAPAMRILTIVQELISIAQETKLTLKNRTPLSNEELLSIMQYLNAQIKNNGDSLAKAIDELIISLDSILELLKCV